MIKLTMIISLCIGFLFRCTRREAPSAEPSESLSGDGVQGKAAECKGTIAGCKRTVAGVWRKAHGRDFQEGESLLKPSAEHPPNVVRYWVQDLFHRSPRRTFFGYPLLTLSCRFLYPERRNALWPR